MCRKDIPSRVLSGDEFRNKKGGKKYEGEGDSKQRGTKRICNIFRISLCK